MKNKNKYFMDKKLSKKQMKKQITKMEKKYKIKPPSASELDEYLKRLKKITDQHVPGNDVMSGRQSGNLTTFDIFLQAASNVVKATATSKVTATSKETSALDHQVGGNHYKDMKIQPIEFIMDNNLSFLQGNVIKYVVRHPFKNGIEDLRKARHYIDLMIEELEGVICEK